MLENDPDFVDKNELLRESLSKQLKNINPSKKLQYSDLKRICKYIDKSMFDENKCCLWTGYVTNVNNSTKGTYINFFYKKKKVALHRLLYINFIGPLSNNEYLKFTCESKGVCCNIHHLKKFKYQKIVEKNSDIEKKKDKEDNMSLCLDFD